MDINNRKVKVQGKEVDPGISNCRDQRIRGGRVVECVLRLGTHPPKVSALGSPSKRGICEILAVWTEMANFNELSKKSQRGLKSAGGIKVVKSEKGAAILSFNLGPPTIRSACSMRI